MLLAVSGYFMFLSETVRVYSDGMVVKKVGDVLRFIFGTEFKEGRSIDVLVLMIAWCFMRGTVSFVDFAVMALALRFF